MKTAIFCFVMAAFALACGIFGQGCSLASAGNRPTKRLPDWVCRVSFIGGAIVLTVLGFLVLRYQTP
jgi:hypothetical protein